MTLTDDLRRVTEAPVLLVRADAMTLADAALRWKGAGLAVWTLRGWKMRTVDSLFDEFAAAMQFPCYFGENWPAFHECLGEMEPLPPGDGLVLAVLDAAQVLVEEPADLGAFRRAVDGAHRGYAAAIASGEWWDRPPVPFHLVLGCEDDSVEGLRAVFPEAVEADLAEDEDFAVH